MRTAKKRLPKGITLHTASGRYYGRAVVMLRTGEKKRITTGYFDVPKEAQDALEKLVWRAERLDPDRRTVSNFLEEWLEAIKPDCPAPKKPRVRTSTYNARVQALAPLLPAAIAKGRLADHAAFLALRSKLLREFSEDDLQMYLDRLRANGVGSRTTQVAYETLRAAWRYASRSPRRYVDLRENPFLMVERPGHVSKAKEPISNDEIRALFEAIRATQATRTRTLLLLLVTSGLRISEALALQWDDLDSETGSIAIREQLTEFGTRGPLKTPESRREVWVVPEVHAGLRALHEVRQSPWIFETPAPDTEAKNVHRRASRGHDRQLMGGKPLDRNNVRTKMLAPVLKRAGLDDKGLTVHSLRSIAATILAPTIDGLALKQHFGWSKLETAAKFYVRQNDTNREAARSAMMKAMNTLGQTKGKGKKG